MAKKKTDGQMQSDAKAAPPSEDSVAAPMSTVLASSGGPACLVLQVKIARGG
jgi:hypothetical protein